MKIADTDKIYTKETCPTDQTDWERLRNQPDDAIDTADMPPISETQWASVTFRRKGVRMTSEEYHAQTASPAGIDMPPVYLSPDIRAAFPTPEAVNDGLRLLLRIREKYGNLLDATV